MKLSKKLRILIFLVLLIGLNPVCIGQEKMSEDTTNILQVVKGQTTVDELKQVENKTKTAVLKTDKKIKIIRKKVTFNPNNINEISNISYEELSELLKGNGMEDIASALIQSEQQYGVNALFLSGLIALESGWGKSGRAKKNNNMGGVAVYSSLSRGVSYASRGSSVLHIAKFIRQDYLNKDGKYYVGCSIWDINAHYCVGKNWSKDIIVIVNELLKKHNNKAKR